MADKLALATTDFVTRLDDLVFEPLVISFGVIMDQEFANFVRQLFAIQDYPDRRQYPDGPPDQPYDVAGWTLNEQMGVRVVAASSPLPAVVRAAMSPVRGESMAWDAGVDDASRWDSPMETRRFASSPVRQPLNI